MTVTLPETQPAVVEKPIDVQILERAADVLEEYGWCQGSLFTTDDEHAVVLGIRDSRITRYCSLGAIWRATADLGYGPDDWHSLEVAAKAEGISPQSTLQIITKHVGLDDDNNYGRLAYYNDAQCPSLQDAAANLRSMAKKRMT